MRSAEQKTRDRARYHERMRNDPEFVKHRREVGRKNQKKYREENPNYLNRIWDNSREPKIYFIQAASGPIKIGTTKKRAQRRLEELQIANHETLTLLATIPGDQQTEVKLHEQFKHLLIRGEWFRPGEDLLSYITTASSEQISRSALH
jgi:hypothetical protein